MRTLISQILVLSFLMMTAGCAGGSGTTAFVSAGTGTGTGTNIAWNAFVSSPSLPIFVTPGQSLTIVVQLIPINGFLLTGPVFFNNFTLANPFLFGCPGLLTVGSPILGVNAFGIPPTLLVPISPIGIGTCSLPFNLGLTGIVSIVVQITSIVVANHAQYVMRLHRSRIAPLPANGRS
jgi:hypothetical protein